MTHASLPDPDALVKGSKLFGFLDASGRQRMLAVAVPRRFAPGDVVVSEGQPGASFFVIVKGQVRISIDDLGEQKDVSELVEGQFFGEIAVITSQPRSATVTAITELQLLEFPKAPVDALLADYPKVRELLGKVGVMRSEDTLEKMLGG